MKTILWTQNETPTTPTTILIDGVECVDEMKRQKAFALLNSANQNLSLSPKKREKLAKEHKISKQANFKVDTGSQSVYIQGNYEDVDAVGRRMPYMFLIFGTTDIDVARKELIDESKIIGRICYNIELAVLTDECKKKIQLKQLLPIAILIIVIMLILVLVNVV